MSNLYFIGMASLPAVIRILLIFISAGIALLVSGRMAHIFHSRLGTRRENCHRRTDTRGRLVFHLSHPNPVIFDFSRRDRRRFEVTIPPRSTWSPLPTFHLSDVNCIELFTLRGRTWITISSLKRWSGADLANPGFRVIQAPYMFLSWGNYDKGTTQSAAVGADTQLFRTLCSVTVDAERYFRLCSTPVWVRVPYAVLGWIPYYGGLARQGLVQVALYVQLRVIFYKNDCWTNQGMIWIDWYWWTAPDWVWDFQGRSMVILSQTTLYILYWIGRLCLGMKESYDEYMVGEEYFAAPADGQVTEKQVHGEQVSELLEQGAEHGE